MNCTMSISPYNCTPFNSTWTCLIEDKFDIGLKKGSRSNLDTKSYFTSWPLPVAGSKTKTHRGAITPPSL